MAVADTLVGNQGRLIAVVGNAVGSSLVVVAGKVVVDNSVGGFLLGDDPLEVDLLIVLIGYELVSLARVSAIVLYLKIQQWNRRHIQ